MAERLNTMGQAIVGAGAKARYDTAAKNLLANKPFLAWILKYTTSEFAGLEPDEIIPYIDNDPEVSTIAVAPGMADRLVRELPQESSIVREGTVTYDIRFYARIPGKPYKEEFNLMIDVEAQNDFYPGYDLVSRGILYCGRMLSEQLGRNVPQDEKTGDYQYKHLQKVYSIWLCFNASQESANTISEYTVQHNLLMGNYEDRARSDLLRVVMVRVPKEGQEEKAKNPASKFHQLLSTVFASSVPVKEKLEKLENEFGIPVTEKIREEVDQMCNLSTAIEDRAMEKVAIEMIKDGKPDEEITRYTKLDASEIEDLRSREKEKSEVE